MKWPSFDRRLWALAASGVVLNLIAWGIAIFFPRHEATAILHYTSSVGIDFVGEGRHIIVLPAAGLLILIVNLIVGRLIVEADYRTSWVLWSTVPIVQVVIILALVFLWSINS